FPDLPCAADRPAQETRGTRLMEDGLTVTTDQSQLHACSRAGALDHPRIEITQEKIEIREFGNRDFGGVRVIVEEAAYLCRIGKMLVVHQLHADGDVTAVDAEDGDVDAVSGGAAHHPGNDHACAAMRAAPASCSKSAMPARSCSISTGTGGIDGRRTARAFLC